MKKFLALTLCVLMVVFALASCGADKKDEPAAKEKLVIGITDYEPMNYMDENGEWTGFDTEFAIAVCEKLGYEAEFKEIEWENKWIALEAGDIDCIWNGMTITDEVNANSSCTKAYVINAQVVVMAADKIADYADAESMKDLSFAVEAGSAGQEAGEENGFNMVECDTQSSALMSVKSGKADACIIDITMANAMTGEGTDYADLGPSISLTSEEYGIAFKKGSELTEKVNGLIDELVKDGTLPALAEKYELTLAD